MDEIGLNNAFAFLQSGFGSDIGRRRKKNEDSIACLPERGVFCVADGMGGEDSGDVASQAVVRGVNMAMGGSLEPAQIFDVEAKCRLLEEALGDASEWIRKRAEEKGRGLSGSTVVMLAFGRNNPAHAVALHAGDSRLYRLRDDDFVQLTRDHSMAEEAGLSKNQLPKLFRGMVTRAVGIEKKLTLARTETDVRENDLFLLCSDGLTGMLADRKIRKLLRKDGQTPLDNLAAELIAAANEAGGDDNVSVILVRVGPLPAVLSEAETQTAATAACPETRTETRTDPLGASRAAATEEETERETAETLPLDPTQRGEASKPDPRATAAIGQRHTPWGSILHRLLHGRCHS